MTILTPRLTRIIAAIGLVATLAGGSLGTAFASSDSNTGASQVTIAGGTLSGGHMTFSDFSAITLNGTQRTATATWSTAPITDATGTGAGWHLDLELTQLQQWDATLNSGAGGYVTGLLATQQLTTSSILVTTAPTVSKLDLTSSDPSGITPVGTMAALDGVGSVPLLSAAANAGMGSYAVTDLTATLTVPASAYAATYKTDATVSLDTTP